MTARERPARLHEVVVDGIAGFVDAVRWIGPDETLRVGLDETLRVGAEFGALRPGAAGPTDPARGTLQAVARLPSAAAADVVARIDGLVVGGVRARVSVVPPLSREVLRQARLVDARRRREVTPGFLRAGTRLDEEGRVSLTPEPLATALAGRLAAAGARAVLDVCAGAGGDAIAFARAGLRVVAVERERRRLALLAHNAAVYAVRDRIELVHGDAIDAARARRADVLYVDPPWAGASARRPTSLDAVPPLRAVLEAARGRFARTVLKLPPSFDVAALPSFRPTAVFGAAAGDARRIKLLLLEAP